MPYDVNAPTFEAIHWTGSNLSAIESFVEAQAGSAYTGLPWVEDEDSESEQYGWLSCTTNTPAKIRIYIPTGGYLVYGPTYSGVLDWTPDNGYNGFEDITEALFLAKFTEQV